MADFLSCPWCGYEDATQPGMQYHIEEHHTDDSPFVVKSQSIKQYGSRAYKSPRQSISDDGNISSDTPQLKCTRPGCGQYIELKDIDVHLRAHDQAGTSYNVTDAVSKVSDAKGKGKAIKSAGRRSNTGSLLSIFTKRSGVSSMDSGIKKARLGREELGYYAYEKTMPASVRKALEAAECPVTQTRITSFGKLTRVTHYPNETSGLIDILATICSESSSTTTYLCHNSVKHIRRVKCDGNFCGYWNIQMLLSFVLATSASDRGLPTVLQIQETIEAAWEEGICAYGKIETGGIYNTRKWIGTHEALAFFTKIGLTVSAASFKDDAETGRAAHDGLLDFVEAYFVSEDTAKTCTVTDRPPIYLQRAGHSITIIGMQRRKSGKRILLVFDPSHETESAMTRLINGGAPRNDSRSLLEPYMRPERRLAGWHEYEVMTIESCEGLRLPGGDV